MPMSHAAGLCAALASFLFACAAAAAHDVTVGDLTIRRPWARATPGGAEVAGGYVTILNKGAAPERLTGGSSPVAAHFELHQMSMDGGVMKMRPTGPLQIPAGGRLTLDPSGTHIMLTGLKRGLKKGETFDGTLVFEHAGPVPVQFDVEGLGAKGPAADNPSGQAGHPMSGMN